jgi:hypothetical protein
MRFLPTVLPPDEVLRITSSMGAVYTSLAIAWLVEIFGGSLH